MTHFYADKEEYAALEKKGFRKGRLLLYTLIEVRGNPKKGAVPVTITYFAQFTPDEKYQEIDELCGEVCWASYSQGFENKNERDMFVDSFYWIEGKRKGWLPNF